MDLHDLFDLKYKIEDDLEREIKRKDFPTEEAYRQHLHSAMYGVTYFFVVAMNRLLDEEGSKHEDKKSA